VVAGTLELSADHPEGVSISMAHNASVLIQLGRGTRFFFFFFFKILAPQPWLQYRGSLAMELYVELERQPSTGINDIEGRRIAFDPLPSKVNIIYQLPVRESHGLRTSPYATVPTGIIAHSSFPLLLRLMPIIKGVSEELEQMRFVITARPILGDEGAVRLLTRYPDQLRNRPFTVLIDDAVVENMAEERLLKEGEHHLVVLSEDYRNESRRFVVEKAKRLDLIINLQDSTPLLIFEAPENARIFLDNNQISRETGPVPVEPGVHEAKFQVGDYTLTRVITVQRGKTYRITLAVGIDINEGD
jgi:hypothetical protein